MGNNVDGPGCHEQSLRKMVEVFKTNVGSPEHAEMLVRQIHITYNRSRANFDLEDSDNILRVEYPAGTIQPELLVNLLSDFGFEAEVLPDEYSPTN